MNVAAVFGGEEAVEDHVEESQSAGADGVGDEGRFSEERSRLDPVEEHSPSVAATQGTIGGPKEEKKKIVAIDPATQKITEVATDVQPTVSLSPATATHGVSRLFTATVTDPAGLSSVSWSFGDGTASVTTTTNTRSHNYAATGSYKLTTIVTDNHGNTRKTVLTVTVS